MIDLVFVPCFPSKQTKVVEPEPDAVKYRSIQRYGETQIHHVNRPLRPEQWKKNQYPQDPNAGRALPQVPQEPAEPKRLSSRPPMSIRTLQSESHRTPRSESHRTKRPESGAVSTASTQRSQPVKADFFISVPIFNETFNHSYRKKNEYVYRDTTDDDASVYHQSISRGSSLRDVRHDSLREVRHESMNRTAPVSTHGKRVEKKRARSLQRLPESRRKRVQSGSEASYNTHSTTYSYESERFEDPYQMRRAESNTGLVIDSDDEDYR